MRTAEVLWIQADKHITQNLGKGNPGNQPMASLFTRVFFGFPATDIGKNTTLGDVMMTSPGGGNRISRPIRVGNNGMEIITLPTPGGAWPSAWDDEILLFRRVVSSSEMTFELKIASKSEAATARRKSVAAGTLRTMKGGREWGVY